MTPKAAVVTDRWRRADAILVAGMILEVDRET
jgi:hypothetical protein